MKHFIYIILFLTNVIVAQNHYHLPSDVKRDDYLEKTIIIKVKPTLYSICFIQKINDPLFNKLYASIGGFNLQKKYPRDKSPEKKYNELGQRYADLSLIYELNYTEDLSLEKAINKLLASNILLYAEPHFVPKIKYTPNDPLANATNQYHLQTIKAFTGWDIDKGDSAIAIGITDTGTDPSHVDLVHSVKRNYGDPIDGIDNDNDGYTDNYVGWDLGVGDNDPTTQGNHHGVHVAGLASGTSDNSIGGSGTGFYCKFLPIKIADANGNLTAAYEGIKYAADHGCSIINCSWGGGGSSQYGQDIIDYATINKNSLVIAAAGNNGVDGDFYPAAYNYVLSVANTSGNDAKFFNSNYGYFIDVCAPGDNVNSTWPGDLYIISSGTSMSSPVVSGAAGIVKNHFPSYNGLQVAERLKVTCDNIDAVNPSYLNKLGAGRINLYRALTDPDLPSVVFTDKIISDHNDDFFITGDTLFIVGNFINYLGTTTALNVTINPLSSYATSIDNTTSLGVINTLSSKTNALDSFSFKLNTAIPTNYAMDFEVLLSDGNYQAKQYFTVYVNVDYMNITINDVKTTATSKGKIGYNKDAQIQGLGFKYKDVDLLYEAGLMIGIDTTKVSDCVRGANTAATDNDFSTISKIIKPLVPYSDFDTKVIFNNNLSTSVLPVEIEQNTYAWNSIPNTQFVIWEYYIKNTHATDTLKNLYAGIFADWDIDGATFYENRSGYDAASKMGYSYYTGQGGKYAGIKLLTNSALANFYAIDNLGNGGGGLNLSDGFDTKEKYKSLSTLRLTAGMNGNGNDVINIMSTGGLTIAPGEKAKVAFAIIGGDSIQNLISGANQAQIKYDMSIPSLIKSYSEDNGLLVFPNPTNHNIIISQQAIVYTKLEIYSINGSVILQKELKTNHEKINLSSFVNGMYIVKLIAPDQVLYKKIVKTD